LRTSGAFSRRIGYHVHVASDERREAPRHLACFPAEIDPGQEWATTALIRDLSVTGALLYVREPFVVGEPITLQLHLSDDLGPRHASARVLRVENSADDGEGMWPLAVAVRFDEALNDIEAEVAELERRQAGRPHPR
jgi:hypothetical protein